MEVKVRYAPSPTGNPHVGNLRTALFTFLLARRSSGQFLLRIEDTDKKRALKESYTTILDSLKWLGLTFDGEVIYQSKRLDIYKEHAQKLLDKGLAFKSDAAIYFKTKKSGQTAWVDLVGGKRISFDNLSQEDFVILKSDGYPTYHLASVVDDHLMGITHVTRGEDWISSTPKHIMLYQAFGWDLPQFVHFPNILASDRSKLSKRHGVVGIMDFKKDGFLPPALINYLALLGWTPPSGKEILSLEEMIKEFDLKDINTSPAIFDIQKLEWLNGEYIRKSQNSKLKGQIFEYLEKRQPEELIEKIVPLVKDRIKKLSDVVPLCDFLWEAPEYDKAQYEKLKIKNQKEILQKIQKKLEEMEKPWQADVFEKTFRELADEEGVKAGDIFQLIRVAVSGQLVTPPLFESIKILGEEETLKRVQSAVDFFIGL